MWGFTIGHRRHNKCITDGERRSGRWVAALYDDGWLDVGSRRARLAPEGEGGGGEDREGEDAERKVVADEKPEGVDANVDHALLEGVRVGFGGAEGEANAHGGGEQEHRGGERDAAKRDQAEVGGEVDDEHGSEDEREAAGNDGSDEEDGVPIVSEQGEAAVEAAGGGDALDVLV